jgi:hypothetical protein
MSKSAPKPLVLELIGSERAPVELPRAGVLTIGSSPKSAHFHVEGQGVADVHCAIGRIKGGGWAIKDLGSEYGTYVNGERVQSVRLQAGDSILVGSRRLRVADPRAAEQAAAPAPSAAPAAPNAPMAPMASGTSAPPATSGPGPRAGKTAMLSAVLPKLAGYRITGKLGRGGMGDVYLAVQEKLDRQVAIKILSGRLAADADFVARFQAEARAAAALNHPNVVTVHDVGEAVGYHYLSMEYMDKGNLEGRLTEEGKLDWHVVLDVLHDATKGLEYAEMRGIVHRDIKPANLMLNEAGTTKLADLGLATHLEAEVSEADNKKIFGTPHFISPEQARGERVDCRSDLYSLGATAYRLLSGHTPFEGSTTRDILKGHFFETPPKLSERVPDVPPELERIVMRLLEKKPDDRFPSAAVLLKEIDRLRSQSVHGLHAGAHPSARPRRVLVIGALVVVLAGVGIFALLRGDGEKAPDDRPAVAGSTAIEAPPPLDDLNAPDPKPIGDDDTQLKLLETRAELAYVSIPGEFTPAERRDELRDLAERFANTTRASLALEEAAEIDRELSAAQAAAAARKSATDGMMQSLESAATGGSDLPAPAVKRLIAVEGQAELAALEPGFGELRRQLYRSVLRKGLESANAKLTAAEALARTGDFDGFQAQISELIDDTGLPALPADLAGPDFTEKIHIDSLHSGLEARLENIDAERARFDAELMRADARIVAGALAGPTGIESELRRFDFEAATARLEALESRLGTEPARNEIRRLAEGLASGRQALEMVAGEFTGWRRTSMRDPRNERRTRNAVAATQLGVTFEGSNDGFVPWSAFGGNPGALHQLFVERLSRPYTTQELESIATLMRISAVVRAIEVAGGTLDRDTPDHFGPVNAAELLASFDDAGSWAREVGDARSFDRERRAAQLLAGALRALDDESWSMAVSELELLLADYRDTLLVLLLSSGNPPELAPRVSAPAQEEIEDGDGEDGNG